MLTPPVGPRIVRGYVYALEYIGFHVNGTVFDKSKKDEPFTWNAGDDS
jgi:FKBP-type peptidyl-prolyl cis-trans isomerase